jgi:hypothetical protein
MKIRPVGAELFHADRRKDGQTYMTNLIVALRNFANSAKNSNRYLCLTISQFTREHTHTNMHAHTQTHTGYKSQGLAPPPAKPTIGFTEFRTKISFTSLPIFPSHSLTKYRDITLSDNCRYSLLIGSVVVLCHLCYTPCYSKFQFAAL